MKTTSRTGTSICRGERMVCSNTSDNQTILRAGPISYSLGELARSAVPQLSNKAACQAEQFGGQLRVGSPAQHDRCKEEDSHNFSWLIKQLGTLQEVGRIRDLLAV